jgi:hypothetical protein
MPTEYRKIVFTNQEAANAIHAHARRSKVEIPVGDILSYDFTQPPEEMLLLTMRPPGDAPNVSVRLESSFIAAALIAYCIAHKIPLPKAAKKSISIQGSSVALDLQISKISALVPADEIVALGLVSSAAPATVSC